jgi:hypothetical protein
MDHYFAWLFMALKKEKNYSLIYFWLIGKQKGEAHLLMIQDKSVKKANRLKQDIKILLTSKRRWGFQLKCFIIKKDARITYAIFCKTSFVKPFRIYY